jgi:hypothetical protein
MGASREFSGIMGTNTVPQKFRNRTRVIGRYRVSGLVSPRRKNLPG